MEDKKIIGLLDDKSPSIKNIKDLVSPEDYEMMKNFDPGRQNPILIEYELKD